MKKGSKKPKEQNQCIQLSSEILRLVISRSEDIAIIKAISDRKSGKLRLQTAMAEKTLQDVEHKEDWRLSKEDTTLMQLFSVKIENPVQKKEFEKIARKALRVSMQFEDEPSDLDMNTSEVHVHKIMNAKIGPDNTCFILNDRGNNVVSVPSAKLDTLVWREQYSRATKILESCIYGDLVFPYNALCFCVQYNRESFRNELTRQWQAMEDSQYGFMTKKKSKSVLSMPIKRNLPEPEWIDNMVRMLLDQNVEIDRVIKQFKADYNSKHDAICQEVSARRNYNLAYKTHRAQNYEKYPAVDPYTKTVPLYTFEHPDVLPEILFDIEDPYFDEDTSIEQRVKIIHSCIVIQKAIVRRRKIMYSKISVILQKYTRMLLAKLDLLHLKLHKFKQVFLWERLKHWYPLLVNKWRMSKNPHRFQMHYSEETVLHIQRCLRGFFSRKKTRSRRQDPKARMQMVQIQFFKEKQTLWRLSCKFEVNALNQSQGILEELVESKLQAIDVTENTNKLQRTEIQYRKEYLHKARIKRLEFFD